MRFLAYKTSKKMVFISFLIIGLMSFLSKTSLKAMETVKIQDPTEPAGPLIILFFENKKQNDQAEQLVKRLIKEQELLHVLGIQPSLPMPKQLFLQKPKQMAATAASAPDVERSFIPQPQESKFLTENVEFIQFIHRTDKPQGMDMIEVIKTAKKQSRPVIMIVGGDKGGGFTALTKEIPSESIHSAILFNPKVGTAIEGTEINFNVIQHRVYNFWSKMGQFKNKSIQITGFWRKFTPAENGFVNSRSKISNIWCRQEIEPNRDEDVNLFEYDWSWLSPRYYTKNLLEDNIFAMNIPAIIQKANQFFNINWDLVCITKKSPQQKSIYTEDEIPLLFINRPVYKHQEKDVFYLGHKDIRLGGTTLTEDWSYKISTNELPIITGNLELEDKHDLLIKARFMTSEGSITSPTIIEVLDKNKTLLEKIKGWKKDNLGVKCLGTFFIPHQDELDLMVFVRSGDKQFIEPNSFSLNITNAEKPYYAVELGQGNDFLYYAVLKFKIAPKHRELNYSVFHTEKSIAEGLIPPIPPDNFTFAVYGDVQKQNPRWPHESDQSGSAAKYLCDVFKENGDLNALALHLIVGDLVLDGSNLVDFGDILKYLKPIVGDHLMATAIGTHDFASKVIAIPTLGLKGTPKILYFEPTMPTMGHLFYFRNPEDQKLKKLEPNEHVKKTHGYFDVGRTRFIHLPLATEEENTPATYHDQDPKGWEDYAKLVLKKWGYSIVGGFWFDFDIAEKFIANLRTAYEAKTHGNLDFIIVYGHAPLVTAPNYHMHHKGLFNSLGLDEFSSKGGQKRKLAEKILPAIAEYGVDAYFCGHNHHYDRCSLKVNFKNGRTVEIPMITIGLGNELRTSILIPDKSNTLNFGEGINDIKNWSITSDKMLSKSNEGLLNSEHVLVNNLFLPAYLKCEVKDKTIICKLLGKNKKELDFFQIIDSLVQFRITQKINLFSKEITQEVTQEFKKLGITNWKTEQVIELPKQINEAINDIFDEYTGLMHFTQLRGLGPWGNEIMSQGKNFAADLKNKITGFVKNLIQQQKLSEPEIIQLLRLIKINIMTAYGQLVNQLQQITGYTYSSHSFEGGQIKPNPMIERKTTELKNIFAKTSPKIKEVINIWIDGFNTHLMFAPTEEELNAQIQKSFDNNKVLIEKHIQQMSASSEEEL